MDYHIAIPSYKRFRTICTKTLATLSRYQIPLHKVTVFVVPEEEQLYKDTLPPEVSVVVGKHGINNQRYFITQYFPSGSSVVYFDDDIEDFFFLDSDHPSIDEFIKKGFATCRQEGCRLWGIYPVANKYFMSAGYSTSVKYIIGSFYGLILNNPEEEFETGDKEDFYRSIKYYLIDGKVIRLNDISLKSKYYTEPGGLQETRTKQTNLSATERLVELFPGLCTMYIRKRTGMAELRLKDRRNRTLKPQTAS